MDHRLLGCRMEAARFSLRSGHSPDPRARGTPVVTRFWRAARHLRLRPELAHTSDRDTCSHRYDADALDYHLRMVNLQKSRPGAALDQRGAMGIFLRDGGRLDDKGPYPLRLYPSGCCRLLVSRTQRPPRAHLERMVDVARAAGVVCHLVSDRLRDVPGVLQRCGRPRIHEPLRPKSEGARETAANLVLLSARGPQVRALEPARHRLADRLRKCAEKNNL